MSILYQKKVDDSIHIRLSLAISMCTGKFVLSITNSQHITTENLYLPPQFRNIPITDRLSHITPII